MWPIDCDIIIMIKILTQQLSLLLFQKFSCHKMMDTPAHPSPTPSPCLCWGGGGRERCELNDEQLNQSENKKRCASKYEKVKYLAVFYVADVRPLRTRLLDPLLRSIRLLPVQLICMKTLAIIVCLSMTIFHFRLCHFRKVSPLTWRHSIMSTI